MRICVLISTLIAGVLAAQSVVGEENGQLESGIMSLLRERGYESNSDQHSPTAGISLSGLLANESDSLNTEDSRCETDCGCDKLFGFIARGDQCFSDFISPMTNPVYFEDPRTLSEVRFIFLQHKLPPGLGGDSVRLVAAQVRAALTDDLSLIATKDGFIFADGAAPLDDGWADINIGLKYNLMRDPEYQRILSVGTTFELPVGSHSALQGSGDGEFHLFASYGAAFFENWHFVTGTGFRLPTDTHDRSQMFYWSSHVDRRIGCSNFYFLAEANWFNWIRSGTTGIGVAGIEGGDLFNFGTPGVAGNDIVTGAFGLKYVPYNKMEIGVALEAPLTDRRDLLDNRLTADWIIRY